MSLFFGFWFFFNAIYRLQAGEVVPNTTVERCTSTLWVLPSSHLLPFHLSDADGIRQCAPDGLDNARRPMKKCGQYLFCVGSTFVSPVTLHI